MGFTEGGIYKDIYGSGQKGQSLVEDELEKTKNFSGAEPAVQLPKPKMLFPEVSMVTNRM